MDHKYAYFVVISEYLGVDGKTYYHAFADRMSAWEDNGMEMVFNPFSTGKTTQFFLARSKADAEKVAKERNDWWRERGCLVTGTTELAAGKHVRI